MTTKPLQRVAIVIKARLMGMTTWLAKSLAGSWSSLARTVIKQRWYGGWLELSAVFIPFWKNRKQDWNKCRKKETYNTIKYCEGCFISGADCLAIQRKGKQRKSYLNFQQNCLINRMENVCFLFKSHTIANQPQNASKTWLLYYIYDTAASAISGKKKPIYFIFCQY